MNICFSTLGCCDRNIDSIISLVKLYKMNAVEIRGIGGVLDNRNIPDFSSENIIITGNKLKNNGVSPLIIGTSCMFHNPDKYDDALDEGAKSIDIAKKLGAKYIRVFGDKFKGERSECTQKIISGLSYLCECDREIGVLLEVHGECNTIEALSSIIDKTSIYENFGVLWDIQHSHRSYGENWREFFYFIRPYVKHVHIKDYSDKKDNLTLIGDGNIPIKEIINALLLDGYGGYFSLEWEKQWHPELPDIEYGLNSFIRYINDI